MSKKSPRYVIPHFKDQENVPNLLEKIDVVLASTPGVVRILVNRSWGVTTFAIESDAWFYTDGTTSAAVFSSLFQKLSAIHPECICYSYNTLDRDSSGMAKIQTATPNNPELCETVASFPGLKAPS